MSNHLYLKPNEWCAIQLLADNRSREHIKRECDIPLSGIYAFFSEIKRKTGIQDMRSGPECREYIERYSRAIATPGLPPDELVIVQHVAIEGDTFEGIASLLSRLNPQAAPRAKDEIRATFEKACERAGVFTSDPRARVQQLRAYLMTFHMPEHRLGHHESQFLPLFAEGKNFETIALLTRERVQYVRRVIRDACKRFSLNSRGRDTQRNLVKMFLDTHAPAQPVTMDDPAFN